MRRKSPRILSSLYAGRGPGIATFLTLAAIISLAFGAISITITKLHWPFVVISILLIMFTSILVAYYKGKSFLPDEIIDDEYFIASYCSKAQLAEAVNLTKPYYGRHFITCDIAEQWRTKDPKAFVRIVNQHSELCASFGILGFDEGFFDSFVQGIVTEDDFDTDHILSLEDCKRSKRLYISGVVVKDPVTPRGGKHLFVMIWAIIQYLTTQFPPGKREILALAVNTDSNKILKKLGFAIAGVAEQRKDKCTLYSIELTDDTIRSIIQKIGDMSVMCRCDY